MKDDCCWIMPGKNILKVTAKLLCKATKRPEVQGIQFKTKWRQSTITSKQEKKHCMWSYTWLIKEGQQILAGQYMRDWEELLRNIRCK